MLLGENEKGANASVNTQSMCILPHSLPSPCTSRLPHQNRKRGFCPPHFPFGCLRVQGTNTKGPRQEAPSGPTPVRVGVPRAPRKVTQKIMEENNEIHKIDFVLKDFSNIGFAVASDEVQGDINISWWRWGDVTKI